MAKTKQWRVELNEKIARDREWKLSEKNINDIRADYQKIDVTNPTYDSLFQGRLAILKGPLGQEAYVRHNSSHENKHRYTLVIELPLETTARQHRESVAFASNFFKPLFTAQREEITKGKSFSPDFRHKPFREHKLQTGENFAKAAKAPMVVVRSRNYDQIKLPYGSVSTFNAVRLKRDTWIKERYKTLKSGQSEFDTAKLISDELKSLKSYNPNLFGEYPLPKKRHPFDLKPETILKIVYLKKKSSLL